MPNDKALKFCLDQHIALSVGFLPKMVYLFTAIHPSRPLDGYLTKSRAYGLLTVISTS